MESLGPISMTVTRIAEVDFDDGEGGTGREWEYEIVEVLGQRLTFFSDTKLDVKPGQRYQLWLVPEVMDDNN